MSRFEGLMRAIPGELFIVCSCMANLSAQEPLLLQRIGGPVELDGLSFEPAWRSIEPLPMVMQAPNFGEPPTEPTEIRVAYDDVYLYVIRSGAFLRLRARPDSSDVDEARPVGSDQ